MTRPQSNPDDYPEVQPVRQLPWRRWLLVGVVPPLLVLFCLILLWNTFFQYVPPGKMLIIIAKSGTALPDDQVVAAPGQKGIQGDVLGEGWHFVMPLYNTTELKDMQTIGPNEVGIVTAKGGVPPRDGRLLAEQNDEKGIRRRVLTPGSYRMNPYAFTIEAVPVTEIKPGFVGALRRRLGKPSTDRFADKPEEEGILRDVLHPGIYYINTVEYRVIHAEVGIDQTTYHASNDPKKPSTAIVFTTKDGFQITMDCTIEWEVLPQDQPQLVADYGDWHTLETNLINQQVEKISRDRGFNYSVEDILDGYKREAFQNDFTKELERVCHEKNVVVRSAFIRNMVLPPDLLKQKRDRQLAFETKVTNKEREETASSDADVEKEKKEMERAEANFKAETDAKVVQIRREIENLKSGTTFKIERMTSEYNAKIAAKESQKKLVLGEAETDVIRLKKTAESSAFKMKMDVFQNDGNAYLKYAMAEQMNKDLKVRMFHSGPGTFWTNMGDKNMNLMMSVPPGTDKAEKAVPDGKSGKDKE